MGEVPLYGKRGGDPRIGKHCEHVRPWAGQAKTSPPQDDIGALYRAVRILEYITVTQKGPPQEQGRHGPA